VRDNILRIDLHVRLSLPCRRLGGRTAIRRWRPSQHDLGGIPATFKACGSSRLFADLPDKAPNRFKMILNEPNDGLLSTGWTPWL
jgi:hypothetical protein